MLEPIAYWIADKAGLTIGTTLQIGHRTPSSPVECSVVLETAGGTIHPDLPDRIDKHIQVLSRAKTYFTARDMAINIYDSIYRNWSLGSAGWTLPIITTGEEYEVMNIEPLSDPQYIGQDEKGRYEFSTNYIFRIKNANL